MMGAPAQPMQVKLVPIFGGSGFESLGKIFTVPKGKRLVIENVAAFGQSRTPGQHFFVLISLHTAKDVVPPDAQALAGGAYPFVLTDAGIERGDGSRFLVVNQTVRLYADPETEIQVNLFRDDLTGSEDYAQVTLTGYLVDVP